MAASWAQYQAQDALIKTCEKAGIELTLFHGRGGSIGRGGAPAHAALLSQPPGSLKGGLRVTEQGEMIRFKYGLPEITVSSLSLYTGRFWKPTCCHRLSRKRAGVALWMNCQSSPAISTVATYVKTKILCLTSAPLRRNKNWVNCRWVHVRRNVARPAASSRCAPFRGFCLDAKPPDAPRLAGCRYGAAKVVEDGKQSELEAMCRDWPFFSTRLGMLEMVFAKADLWLAEYYDQRLVDKALWPLGKELRNLQEEDIKVVLAIANDSHLMADLPWIAESIQLRNIYTDPLNVLQAELLHRSRQAERRP